MKKMPFIFAAIVAAVFACSRLQVQQATAATYTDCYCARSCDSLCSYIPRTLKLGPPVFQAGYQATLDSAHQPPFDMFSWQSFVALNWPAGPGGQALPGPIGKDPQAQRVWESYSDVTSIFGDTSGLPVCVQEAMRSGKRVLSATSKGQFVIDPDGAFAESKEAIAGYFLLAVASTDEAVRLAQACPILACGAQIEVRPIADVCRPMAEVKAHTHS